MQKLLGFKFGVLSTLVVFMVIEMSWIDGTDFSPTRMRRLSGAIPSSYTVFKYGSTYYAETNIPAGTDYSGTDPVTVIHSARDALASTGGTIFLKNGIYESNTYPIILTTNNIGLVGEGSDRDQVYFTDPPTPLVRLTKGTVLKNTGTSLDTIQITGERYGNFVKDLSIDFTQTSTGHGINCQATNTVGLSEFTIDGVVVNNHDASHYALRMENGVLGTVNRLTSYGGGLLELISETTAKGNFNSGNIVFTQLSGWLCWDLANHGVYIHRASGAGWTNLNLFDRLFIIMKTTIDPTTYSALRCEYMHHSQFNMLNIEMTYTVPADVVHLAACHDTDFFSPYVMYSANAGWVAFTDCTTLNVFGGTVDVAIDDKPTTLDDHWWGVYVHSIAATNTAKMHDCMVYNAVATDFTVNRGTATILNGNANVVVTHGLRTNPTNIRVLGTTADTNALYVDTLTATQFTINAAGAVGGDRTVYWIASVDE